ncbi:TPA: multidrug DMT transporter permease [Escherichia coli]|nr:multidrug DMT transporter permease [Escherichia coli]
MGIITNAVASALGLSSSAGWAWRDHIRQASFRGVPFAVVSADGMYGRRVAIHEYPFRDSVWIEDLGRSARRFTVRGFLIQDCLVYSAGDVFAQRDALIAACETGESGLLVHPTLGELTVYVPDGGLRIEEGVESERVFTFTLAFVESGEKVFSVVSGTTSSSSETWFKTMSTMASVTLATITGEMNGVTGAIREIKSTVSAWQTILASAGTSVTGMVGTVSSLFSPSSYSRFCTGNSSDYATGSTSSTASALRTWLSTTDADDDEVMSVIRACSVSEQAKIDAAVSALDDIATADDMVARIKNVITLIACSLGSAEEKIRLLEEAAVARNGAGGDGNTSDVLSSVTQAYICGMAAGAMLWCLMQYTPVGLQEADRMMGKARTITGDVLLLLADTGDDDGYAALNAQYTQFVQHWQSEYLSPSSWMAVKTRMPQPSLSLANRLYQDASRADELVQVASPVHPAFMPVSFKARNT